MRRNFTGVLLLLICLNPVHAAEFASIVGLKAHSSHDNQGGMSLSYGYGGFGLAVSAEVTRYKTETVPGFYLGIAAPFRLEVGMGNQGLSARAGLIFTRLGHIRLFENPVLFGVNYEHYFNETGFSGFFVSMDMLIRDD